VCVCVCVHSPLLKPKTPSTPRLSRSCTYHAFLKCISSSFSWHQRTSRYMAYFYRKLFPGQGVGVCVCVCVSALSLTKAQNPIHPTPKQIMRLSCFVEMDPINVPLASKRLRRHGFFLLGYHLLNKVCVCVSALSPFKLKTSSAPPLS